MNSAVVKKNELYVVDEYQKTKIKELKYVEDKIFYITTLADKLDRFLQFKKYKIQKTKYYVVKINFRNYEIKFIDIKEFLELNQNKN